MTTARWGILGTGLIAGRFVADLQVAGLPVTAVGSRSRDSADAFAGAHDIARAHADYAALASDPEIDVVYVATPHPWHAEHALLALSHGKHVLVEKPLAMNAAEARTIADAAAERGLLAQEAMWTRFLPHMVRLRELGRAGALGDVRAVYADHGQLLPSDPGHRVQDPALGGGALLDLGVYPVSFAVDVLGLPAAITARSALTPAGVDRQTAVLLENGAGAQALLHCALDATSPTTATVVGTAARAEIAGTWYAPSVLRVTGAGGTVIEELDARGEGRGMQHQAIAVDRALAAGRTTTDELPIEESVAIMGVLDEIRRQGGVRYAADR